MNDLAPRGRASMTGGLRRAACGTVETDRGQPSPGIESGRVTRPPVGAAAATDCGAEALGRQHSRRLPAAVGDPGSVRRLLRGEGLGFYADAGSTSLS